MKKAIILTVLSFYSLTTVFAQKDFTEFVDPTIGNVSRFLVPTYPTMHLPNQMLRMFPAKTDYISDQIAAFPLQIISHRTRPGLFLMSTSVGAITDESWNKKMNIDHDLEVYHPWLYSTYLIDEGIRVSFVPGKKAANYKIEFPEGVDKNLLIEGSNRMTTVLSNDNSFSFKEIEETTTRGTNPIKQILATYVYAKITDVNNKVIKNTTVDISKGKFSVYFPKETPSEIYIKYAVSYISSDQAKINFEKELASSDFNTLLKSGKKTWEKAINQIQVKGGTVAQKRSFYTSLYRTYERMVDVNEYGKYYSGYDNKVHESDRPFYVDDWVWDTFRATHPLRTILNPKLQNDMLNSYTLMYEQSGWMPTFPKIYGNSMCMNSYHTGSLFLDGYRKGLRDFDVAKAYEGFKKNMTQGTFLPWRQGTPKLEIDDFYHEKGYYPALYPGEEETIPMADSFEKRQAVAVSLGISYDFWVLSELSKELGKKDDFLKFSKKGKNYKKLWDNNHRLFMPKDDKGNWIDIDPKSAGGPGYRDYYDENNGWTYAWDVQHDISGLTGLLGGKKAAEDRLDQLFREPLGMKRNQFFINGSNSTGLVGQFSMGNEPSFHIPYLYNYFGAPWKTQKRIRFLLDVWFKDNIFGIPGDEDGGGMTAFVVFSSMGLYPTTPGLPFYDITSPIFEKTTINLKNGKQFTVVAEGASRTKKYIQKAFINSKEIFNPFITHKQIMEGSTLKLILGELPNKEWGKEAEIPKF